MVETTMLTIINHQCLIATKASRIVDAADGDGVLEFGLRRAHGSEAGLYGARAAIIGGCAGTSNVETEYLTGLPSKGTMSHSLIQSYDSELEAFRSYAKHNPNNIILLVDTYNTLESGVPNAIKVFTELKERGALHPPYGIRLDSGDLAYLSKEARRMPVSYTHLDVYKRQILGQVGMPPDPRGLDIGQWENPRRGPPAPLQWIPG